MGLGWVKETAFPWGFVVFFVAKPLFSIVFVVFWLFLCGVWEWFSIFLYGFKRFKAVHGSKIPGSKQKTHVDPATCFSTLGSVGVSF